MFGCSFLLLSLSPMSPDILGLTRGRFDPPCCTNSSLEHFILTVILWMHSGYSLTLTRRLVAFHCSSVRAGHLLVLASAAGFVWFAGRCWMIVAAFGLIIEVQSLAEESQGGRQEEGRPRSQAAQGSSSRVLHSAGEQADQQAAGQALEAHQQP